MSIYYVLINEFSLKNSTQKNAEIFFVNYVLQLSSNNTASLLKNGFI